MVYILLYLAQGGCAIHEKDPAGLSADPDDAAVCGRLRRSAADRRHRSEYRATVGGASSGAGRAGDPGAVHSKGLLRRGGIQRLVVVVSLILPLPAALAISGVGTALCLSISYWMGRSTRTDSLEGLLSRHPKLSKYFTATQQYGFVFCFTIHMLGLNMELLGVLFGMMRLNFWTYLSASWLSIAPGMVCLCILGNNLDFKSPVFWAMLALNLVLLLGSLWYTRHKLVQSSSRT